jgi:RNase adaptor protein for sRNA GlmZ degradation
MPDIVTNFLNQGNTNAETGDGEPIADSYIFGSTSVQGLKLDKNEPYGIKNLPEGWMQRLKDSKIPNTHKNEESAIIIDLILSQSFIDKEPHLRELMSNEEYKKAVQRVEIIYENANDHYNIVREIGKGATCRVF